MYFGRGVLCSGQKVDGPVDWLSRNYGAGRLCVLLAKMHVVFWHGIAFVKVGSWVSTGSGL